jgi:hypothetical protein
MRIMTLKVGDLVYAPSEVKLLQFYENIDYGDPTKTYIGKSPIKICRLPAPTNLLLTETKLLDKKYLKVLYDGDEWYVDENDINTI